VLASLLLGAPASGEKSLRAGAAEGTLDAPIGLPLAGYTSRASLFDFPLPDSRAAPFARVFAPSTAVQTPPAVKAVALSAGSETLVLVKVDLIFSDAFLLRAVEDLAAAASREPLRGRVVLAASHSHNSPGRFTQHSALMAGADTYDEATFRRYAESIARVVVRALSARRPARIGVAVDPDFDPLGVDAIFRDRRAANDHLAADGSFLFEPDGVTVDLDSPAARGPAKDPALALVRIDRADGEPLAVILRFGIHGTALGDEAFALEAEHPDERYLWMSGEAGSAVEWKLEESFRRRVVVMQLQGAAGDVSPAGDDLGHQGFARLELLAERARAGALALWSATPTARDVALRVATRQIAQDAAAVHVERGGAVDWRYPAEPGPPFDGDLLSFEDWTFPLGAALCGGRSFDLGAGGVLELAPEERAQVDLEPASTTFGRGLVYGSCTPVDDPLFELYASILDPTLDPAQDGPIPESLSTLATAAVLDGAPLSVLGGSTQAAARVLLAAAPGEPTTYWSERLRSRALAELGFDEAVVVGYAQDHEGYLLLPEDWLSGDSTEVQINLWGPLQGEYLLEQTLGVASLLAPGSAVDPDPGPLEPAPDVWELDPVEPVATPLAGRPLEQPAPEVERLRTASFAWIGGDPAVDQPRVGLQRLRNGVYRNVRLPSGRPLDDRTHRIVLAYRPEPIDAAPEEIREHRYRAWFQVVEDVPDLSHAAGFRTGKYRFRVQGNFSRRGKRARYELFSAPFRVQPTDDLALADVEREGDVLSGRVVLPPAAGYRLESFVTPAGAPIPVAAATVRSVPDGAASTTDVDGRFILTLGPGTSALRVEDGFENGADVPLEPSPP
jgi:neutral ceramidase